MIGERDPAGRGPAGESEIFAGPLGRGTDGGNNTTPPIVSDFCTAIRLAGIEPPDHIEADGELHRFKTNGDHNRNSWYVLYADDPVAGAFGCWKRGISETWTAKPERRMTAAERAELRRRMEAARKQREAEEAKRHASARDKAAAIWKFAQVAPHDHPYLVKKAVMPHGLRVDKGALLVPMLRAGDLHSLQLIAEDGTKKFLTGGLVHGCFFTIGEPDGVLCIAEGFATSASIREATGHALMVAFTSWNLLGVAKEARAEYPDIRLILCADDDYRTDCNPGRTAARDAALAVGGLLAVPDFGEDRPDGATDFNDLHRARGLEAVKRCILEARTVERAQNEKAHSRGTTGERGERGEKPHDTRKNGGANSGRTGANFEEAMNAARKALTCSRYDGPEYPTRNLGPLAEAADAIATLGQLSPALAGQCVLASAALSAQSVCDVQTLTGPKPVSLYALSIGDSGDGKSTAENAALKPIRDWQRTANDRYRIELEAFLRDQEKGKKRVKGEPRIARPPEPYIIMRDGTVEGIRRAFREGRPSQGVFTSEAAAVLCGYGMNADNRSKTAGNFNSLWDDGEVSVSRGLDGRIQMYDRRLSLHWLIQPDAVRHALYDPLLSTMGFWPRFLIAWPEPGAPRKPKKFEPANDPHVRAYWKRCQELLDRPLGEDCRDLYIMTTTAEGEALIDKFFERIEIAAKTKSGRLVEIKPFALRATEHVFRVAGTLAAFEKKDGIDAEHIRCGIAIVTYSLETWLGVHCDREEAESRELALKLYEWLLKQSGQQGTELGILRIGPKPLRSRFRRDRSLALLQQAELVDRECDTWLARTP